MNSDSMDVLVQQSGSPYPSAMTHSSMTTLQFDSMENKRHRDEYDDDGASDDPSFRHQSTRPRSEPSLYNLASSSGAVETSAVGSSTSQDMPFVAPMLFATGGIRQRSSTPAQTQSQAPVSLPPLDHNLAANVAAVSSMSASSSSRAASQPTRAASTGAQVQLPRTDVMFLTSLQALTCGGDACVGCAIEIDGEPRHAFLPIDDLLQLANRRCPDPNHDGATISAVTSPADQWRATPFRHICSTMIRAFSDRNRLAVALPGKLALQQWQSGVNFLSRLLHKAFKTGICNPLAMLQSYVCKPLASSDNLLENATAGLALFGNAISFHNAFFTAIDEIVSQNQEHRTVDLQSNPTNALLSPHMVPFSIRTLIRVYRTLFSDMFPTLPVLAELVEKAFRTALEFTCIETRNSLCYQINHDLDKQLYESLIGPANRLG